MKHIPNVTFGLKIDNENNATAGTLLLLCIKNPPMGGFDFATMRARGRVADVIEKAAPGGELVFEDADYSAAVLAVREMKWGQAHQDILKFAELFGL